MNCNPLTALIAICLVQSRWLSAAHLIQLTKDLHKLLILDGSPKDEGSLSFLQSSLPLKHLPLSLKVKIKWIFLYYFTNTLITNCPAAISMNTECCKHPDRQMSFLKYRI